MRDPSAGRADVPELLESEGMMGTCNCWVKDEPEPECWSLRNGAHNPTCPVYRVSRDPVDALKDADIRDRYDPEDTQPPPAPRICPTCDAGDPTSIFPYHEVCPVASPQ